jgi:SAM-dependent methyltransferase
VTDPLVYNAPLGDDRAAALVAQVLAVEPVTVADLGCGRGAFLLDVLAAGAGAGTSASAGVRGVGVDTDTDALAAAQRAAAERGLSERVTFVAADAPVWVAAPDVDVDVAISVGATHAFGDLTALLRALPGRRVLVGDAFYARAADAWCVETFGALAPGTDAVREIARAAGWRVSDLAVSTLAEWDEFEARWRAGVDADFARQRKDEYEAHYRGVLGFAWLVLDKT